MRGRGLPALRIVVLGMIVVIGVLVVQGITEAMTRATGATLHLVAPG